MASVAPPQSGVPSLSLIVPLKDESSNVGAVVEEVATVLRPAVPDYELILVDDGSTDGTFDLVRRLEDSSGRGRSLSRPTGAIARTLSPAQAALGDFCNALFNSSEFLYTE